MLVSLAIQPAQGHASADQGKPDCGGIRKMKVTEYIATVYREDEVIPYLTMMILLDAHEPEHVEAGHRELEVRLEMHHTKNGDARKRIRA